MMQVGTSQSTTYHNQSPLPPSGGSTTARSSSTSRQQQQFDNEQLANIRPRLCTLRKWPHYDGRKQFFSNLLFCCVKTNKKNLQFIFLFRLWRPSSS